MQDQLEPTNSKQRLCWLAAAIVVCATAFYLIEHNYTISQDLEALEESTVQLDEIVAAGNTTRRIAFALLGAFGLLGWILPGRRDYRLVGAAEVLFCSYFVWCLASACWADDIGLTLRRFGVLIFMFLGIMGITKQLTARDLCWLVVVVCSLHMFWGIAAEIRLGMFHPWTDEYRFAGTIHPNTQGVQCAALCLAALCLAADRRQRPMNSRFVSSSVALIALAAIAAIFLVLTKSRTSCAGALLAGLVIWLPTASRFSKACAFVFVPTLTAGVLLIALLINLDFANRFSDVLLMGRAEEAGTLTGRLPLWTELMVYIRARPILGYGYGGFWNAERMRTISENQGWQIAHSHSAYLETMLNLGFIGALIFLACVMTGFGLAILNYSRTRDAGCRFMCGFVPFAALYSLTDAGFALPNFMTVVLLTGLGINMFARRAATTHIPRVTQPISGAMFPCKLPLAQ